ncbi:MAG: protoheme IX farnesyltransferase [Verrucomicrobiales bacterium]|nr:protoheme IX farnesyltransferase [Verrucomicrobiales bacterium]|tara:strand:- start:4512 stop:5414 length:903 start_codon:yes stop_codon:yes gene_type:complete
MKASAEAICESSAVDRGWAVVLADLFKARLTSLVLLTTLVGYYCGRQGKALDAMLLLHTLGGTGLLACGASALNQYLEREWDSLMKRTASRPLPAGEMQPLTVLFLGACVSVIGMFWLAVKVNLITSFLGGLTLASYVFIYTPLKRCTPLNTLIGAIPGALPPLMGWSAAYGEVTIAGWSLFGILMFWQLPHFLAIAWMYRDEYEQAGYRMLPVVDPTGDQTSRQAVSHCFGLIPMTLAPFVFRVAGEVYLFGALILGMFFLWCAIQFARQLTRESARRLFFASIMYLPLLLGLLVLDRN